MKVILGIYDSNDNVVAVFEDYQECADYLGITKASLTSQLSRIKNGRRNNKILSKIERKIYKIYRIETDD